jgi:hypothetical protein
VQPSRLRIPHGRSVCSAATADAPGEQLYRCWHEREMYAIIMVIVAMIQQGNQSSDPSRTDAAPARSWL